MNATKFIVIGKYDSERNSWIEGGDIRHVVSGHRTESAAWRASEEAHGDLGGCDGSNSLATVMARYARLGSRKSQAYINGDEGDYYEHADHLYVPCDFWKAHKVVAFAGGLGLAVR